MNLADVNILVHALRADSPDHKQCRRWLNAEISSGERFGVSPQVLSSVMRVATHPKIYNPPTRSRDALAFCEALASAPLAVRIEPGPRHWSLFTQLIREANATGNLVPDAWFAALAIEHGCTWVTLDKDYARFKGLRVAAP